MIFFFVVIVSFLTSFLLPMFKSANLQQMWQALIAFNSNNNNNTNQINFLIWITCPPRESMLVFPFFRWLLLMLLLRGWNKNEIMWFSMQWQWFPLFSAYGYAICKTIIWFYILQSGFPMVFEVELQRVTDAISSQNIDITFLHEPPKKKKNLKWKRKKISHFLWFWE